MLRYVLAFVFIGSALGLAVPKDPPEWSSTQRVKGVLMIPYAEIREPFEAWYDRQNQKSRIDYYGGMVKTYQMGAKNKPPYGTLFKVVPVTTETVLNQVTCLQDDGSRGRKTKIQSALPDTQGYHYAGTETIRGKKTHKWQMSNSVRHKVDKYTMWVKYRKNLSGVSVPVPVRYEVHGGSSVLDYLDDYFYIEYEEYDNSIIDAKVFQVDEELECKSLLGARHIATFNPMKEFVYPTSDAHVTQEFNIFKLKHNKTYDDLREHNLRKELFRQNLRFIHSTNRAHLGFTVSVNHLADRTPDELAALRGYRYTGADDGALPFPYSSQDVRALADEIPSEFDWRLFGAVTSVKDQSACSSCWSFSAVGAVEGALFLHTGGQLVRLSEQALIDCSWGEDNIGCDGGDSFQAYEWIKKHGLPSEEEYGGYLAQDGKCHIDNVTVETTITSYVDVTPDDENALKVAILKYGPIAVAIDASRLSFTFYSHGVYYDPRCRSKRTSLDHAVLAVGYGTMKGDNYWLIKNSWSNYWGNDGYILMSARNNNCGVQTCPSYVNI